MSDISSIKVLFSQNKASPFDVNAYGQSALHYAAIHGQVECCKFLIKHGADMYLKDENGRKPIDSAWDRALSGQMSSEEHDKLMVVFEDDDYVNTRQFHILHKIILGILPNALNTQVEASTAGIDDRDANGRTSLAWAAIRKDEHGIKTLLDYGANPELEDFEGNTTLFHSIRVAHPPCIQLLLDYGADVNKRDAFGATALHHASYVKDDPILLEPLIAAQVDVNAIDYDGDTALQYAIRQGHLRNTVYLLDHNADPNIANVGGDTPLLMAIFYQADSILQELLRRDSTYCKSKILQQKILYAVAGEGTVTAIQAFNIVKLANVDVEIKDMEGRTCLDHFKKRDCCDAVVRGAFRNLIKSLTPREHWEQIVTVVPFGDEDEDGDEDGDEDEQDASQFVDALELQSPN